jgi:hypothetical protein
MKNFFRIFMTVVAVVFFTNASISQPKPFQGTITYNVSYSGGNLTPAQKAQLPTTTVVTIKDCKTKTEVSSGMMNQAVITDGTTKTQIILLDIGGENKFSIKQTEQEIAADLAEIPMPTINITNETKVISGYTCKKAILTTKNENDSITTDTVYYSEQIGCADLNFYEQYKGIPGAKLEYTVYIAQIDVTAKYTIKEIEKKKISDNIFLVPSDYIEKTKEELEKMFGGE